MSTISRRDLLQAGYGTAGVLGVSAIAGAAAPATLFAESEPRNSEEPQNTVPNALFYRDDWLGVPWAKPDPVLLIHGNDESSIAWFGWVPRMAQEFRMIRPDLPGFGNSVVPPNFEWTIGNIATSLAHLLDSIGVESAHVVGAKSGGSIAMQFAADYPKRTRTLSLVSVPVTRVSSKIAFAAPSSNSQKNRLGSQASKELVDYWNNLMASTRPETKAGMAKVEEALDMESVLQRISAPTLVITSDRSALQSVDTVLKYQQKIPNSRLLVLTSDGYHLAVIKADECVTGVLSFIKETQRSAGGRSNSAA